MSLFELSLCSIFLIQGLVMLIDEFYYHHWRGLGLWEKLGHPLDTLSLLIPYCICLGPLDGVSLKRFLGFALVSCLLITKDEFVHARECEAGEIWLHSLLFVLHPIAFMSAGSMWYLTRSSGSHLQLSQVLKIQILIVAFFAVYQFVYWVVYRTLYRRMYGRSIGNR